MGPEAFLHGPHRARCESFWARVFFQRDVREVRVFLGMSRHGPHRARNEMVPDSSSGAGARGVSAWAPSCEVMKQILDQSLGCAMLFKNATKTLLPLPPLLHPFHYFSDLRSFCESTFWCCFGSELVHGPSGAPPRPDLDPDASPTPATQQKHNKFEVASKTLNRIKRP